MSTNKTKLQKYKYVYALLASSLACILIAIAFGVLSALYYIPSIANFIKNQGFSLAQLRPMHDTYVSAWIFLAGIAMVYTYMIDSRGSLTKKEKIFYKIHMSLWAFAGLGIAISTLMGYSSGREYMSFSPIFSPFILLGWFFYAWNFLSRVLKSFWSQPAYIYMWTVSAFLFIYVFCEAHAYLIPSIFQYPVADLQIQWKSYGALVASFNHLVYGSLMYMNEKLSGDKTYAQSKIAFSLLAIGLLNSFTNYAHHTYHIPQSHVIKWISFVVSMMEIIILYRVMIDITNSLKRKLFHQRTTMHQRFINLSKAWTGGLLILAILISIPPLNTLIHGTHAITAHAMGSEIAIDSYVLFAVVSYLLSSWLPEKSMYQTSLHGPKMHRILSSMNLSFLLLFLWLLISGSLVGITNFLHISKPSWLSYTPFFFAAFGSLLALHFFYLLSVWIHILLKLRFTFFLKTESEKVRIPSLET